MIVASIKPEELKSNFFKEIPNTSINNYTTNRGGLCVDNFIERPSWLPSSCYYFPLREDNKGYYNTVIENTDISTTSLPSTLRVAESSNNLTTVNYDNDGAHSSPTVNNLFTSTMNNWSATNSVASSNWSVTKVFPNIVLDSNGIDINRLTSTSFTMYLNSSSTINVTAGDYITFSCYVRLASYSLQNTTKIYGLYLSDTSSLQHLPTSAEIIDCPNSIQNDDNSFTITNNWQKIFLVTKYNTAGSFYPIIYWPTTTTSGASNIPGLCSLRFAGIQIEKKSFPNYINNNNTSILSFDLHNKCGINWNGDWTIIYRRKRENTLIDNKAYNKLLAVDCLGDVGGESTNGIAWGVGYKSVAGRNFNIWEHENPITASSSIIPISLENNDIYNNNFYHWETVALTPSNNKVKIITLGLYDGIDHLIKNIDGNVIYQGTSTTAITSADFFCNTYNSQSYDLILGGFINNSSISANSAIYRDLVVIPNITYTDSEIIDTICNMYSLKKITKSNIDQSSLIASNFREQYIPV